MVADLAGIAWPSSNPTRPARPSMPPTAGPAGRSAEKPLAGPTGLERGEAERLVADASEWLWTLEGAAALAYVRGRGLADATIKAARLGWAPKIRLPKRDGDGTWLLLDGVTIPWIDSGRLARINVRRLGLFKGAKYIRAFSDTSVVYPSMAAIRPVALLVIAEGELDAILLAQELAGLASVITTGSTSNRPKGSLYLAMLGCPRWYACARWRQFGRRRGRRVADPDRPRPAASRQGLDGGPPGRRGSSPLVGRGVFRSRV